MYNFNYVEKNKLIPKYYEMFDNIPNDLKIYVKNNTEKNNVITIGMGNLEDKNIIVK